MGPAFDVDVMIDKLHGKNPSRIIRTQRTSTAPIASRLSSSKARFSVRAMEVGHNASPWSQVAHDFGFYDESHFKERMTPGQYRQTLKESQTPVKPT
jgi:hypothetical protein